MRAPKGHAQRQSDPYFAWFERILAYLGRPPRRSAKVLDFGCGEGALVDACRRAGYDAYGCDVSVPHETARIRSIAEPYRLPFPDNYFDWIYSYQVFEHVRNPARALAEISRILTPEGLCLNLFPARWRPIEPHTFVPLATVVQRYAWLRLWAAIGVRNSFQKGREAREVATVNHRFLTSETNYLRRSELIDLASEYFARVRFVEAAAMASRGGLTRRAVPVIRRAPALARLCSEGWTRVVLLEVPLAGTR